MGLLDWMSGDGAGGRDNPWRRCAAASCGARAFPRRRRLMRSLFWDWTVPKLQVLNLCVERGRAAAAPPRSPFCGIPLRHPKTPGHSLYNPGSAPNPKKMEGASSYDTVGAQDKAPTVWDQVLKVRCGAALRRDMIPHAHSGLRRKGAITALPCVFQHPNPPPSLSTALPNSCAVGVVQDQDF